MSRNQKARVRTASWTDQCASVVPGLRVGVGGIGGGGACGVAGGGRVGRGVAVGEEAEVFGPAPDGEPGGDDAEGQLVSCGSLLPHPTKAPRHQNPQLPGRPVPTHAGTGCERTTAHFDGTLGIANSEMEAGHQRSSDKLALEVPTSSRMTLESFRDSSHSGDSAETEARFGQPR